MKKARIAMLIMVSVMLLFGCGKDSTSTFSPEQSSIFVTRDGGISSALVEPDQGKDYQDVQDRLTEYLNTCIAEYNAEKGGEKVTLVSSSFGEGKGIAIFDYASGGDLYDFAVQMEDTANQAEGLTVSTVSEGLIAGKVSDGAWVKAKDGSSVAVDTVTKQGDLKLVSFEGAVTIQTEGKIQFYSGDITLQDDFTAVSAGGKAYIAFK